MLSPLTKHLGFETNQFNKIFVTKHSIYYLPESIFPECILCRIIFAKMDFSQSELSSLLRNNKILIKT